MSDLKTIDELGIVINFEIKRKLAELKEADAKLGLSEAQKMRIRSEYTFISNLNNFIRESKKVMAAHLGKLLPSAVDLEEGILGAIMLEKFAIGEVVEFLQVEHFYDERHQMIFESILDLARRKEPIDMRTVVNKLRKNGTIDDAGGAYYIAELTAKVSSAANIKYHARCVIEFAIKRQLLLLGNKLMLDGSEDTVDCFVLYNHAVDKMNEIQEWTKK